jgi:predicted acetyltransferase
MEIRPITPSETKPFLDAVRTVFGFDPIDEQELAAWRPTLELERTLAVFEVKEIVATANAISFQLTIPGAVVPMAGVTSVSVLPTHRRRGLLRAMMRRQLDDIHARGEPLAGLYASEAPIYGRFGYGMAVQHARLEVPSKETFRPPFETNGHIVMVDRERAGPVFARVWEKARQQQPGMTSLPARLWAARLADTPNSRQGATQHHRVLYETKSVPEGFALYRLKPSVEQGRWNGEVVVEHLIAASREAYAGLWRYLLDIDLMARVSAGQRAVDEPLRHLLLNSKGLRSIAYDGLWLRLVDVNRALSGRRYAQAGRLVFEVRDEFCVWNHGRFQLDGAPEGAACRATKGAADLVLDAADLAAAYLGGIRFRSLWRAGRVVEVSEGALERADRMFATDPLPWSPLHF